MGADTSSTHLIFFIAAMVIASGVVAVIYSNVNSFAGASMESASTVSKQLKTDITVINDPSNIPKTGANYTFYVKNTGRSNLAPEHVTVIINGEMISDDNVTKTVINGTTIWRPADVLQLNVNYASMPSGDNRIKVISENGIGDTMEFTI
jgi:flagellar protein FlaG